MPQEGKPENVAGVNTDSLGGESQTPEQKPANPTVEMSDSVRSYLKGLGLEGVTATAELVKVAEAGMKQKESVSRISFEKEQLAAKLASQGQSIDIPEKNEESEESTPASKPMETEAKIGVTDNDLFDLAQMITTNFKELSSEAQDGSLFRELRQLGYFTSKGINKKDVFDYLSAKNAQAQELRELREFKKQYGQPNPDSNPIYNANPGYNMNAEMTPELAHNIVYSGKTDSPRYNEALQMLRKQAWEMK